MPKKSFLMAGLLSVAFAAFLWLSYAGERAAQLRAVTVYSRHNTSLSVFRDWKETVRGQSVTMNHEAFLLLEKLAGYDGIMIASPQQPLTTREARVLATYVRQGGRLLLSAHDRDTYANLHSLLQALGISHTVADDPGFKNRQLQMVSVRNDTEVFATGKTYGFYSVVQFYPARCADLSLECFARIYPLERGKVLLTLGLPLFGNAMLRHAHNMDFTVALGHWAPRLLIDEYHHFFTQKTWTDLAWRVDVALPLGGMIAGLLLFFLFGHSHFHEQVQHLPISRSYHALNENIVRRFLHDPALAGAALDIQQRFLLRLLPQQAETINALMQQAKQQVSRRPGTLPERLGEVVRFHREQLIRRGRKTNL